MSSDSITCTETSRNSSLEEDEDEDDQFEDALTDLGHLSVNDQDDELLFSDPGLPIFNTYLTEHGELMGDLSQSFDMMQNAPESIDAQIDTSVSPASHNDESSDCSDESSRCNLGANCVCNTQSNDVNRNIKNRTELPLPQCTEHNSSYSHDYSFANVSQNDVLESTMSQYDVIEPTTPLNEAARVTSDSPSSSGMDDFTYDSPLLGDSVITENDVTDTEEDGEPEVRPPVIEVDEEEERVRRLESHWTEEEKEERKLEANSLKTRGNQAFKQGEFDDAEDLYTEALSVCPTCFPNDRSIIYSNRSACKLRKDDDDASLQDCTRALKLNPDYIKCLLRRAELYERCEKLDESLTDYKHVYELDRSIHLAAAAIMRLEQMIAERNEKLKQEMLGQLKNLGNMILKPFGLSTNNFQLQQDSGSGGYSINFQR